MRLELLYEGHVDLTISVMAHVLNGSQYGKPGTWQPHVGPGQADLEGHLITRRLRASHTQPPMQLIPQPVSLCTFLVFGVTGPYSQSSQTGCITCSLEAV